MMVAEKLTGVKEHYNNVKLSKLLESSDDLMLRKEKFNRMREVEKLGNQIWKLNKEKINLKTEITKLEARERQLLKLPIIEREEE